MLTAIAIPVFTTQLEKSREATDMANIRSAYAEIVAASLTDPDNDHTANVPVKQTQAKWQTTGANIAGIDVTDANLDVDPLPDKYEVTYTAGEGGAGVVKIMGKEVTGSFMSVSGS